MSSSMATVLETYANEAQKRLRTDGALQFQDAQKSDSERIRHLAYDAWADQDQLPAAEPAPAAPTMGLDSQTKFMIVGAGIGGIVSAVRLILAGFPADRIRLVEAAGGVGGTWYWNRYPGLHCDVESYVYMPLLEEMGYVPSQKYASGVEIRTYLGKIVEKYQLHDKIVLGTQVTSLQWSEQGHTWKAELSTSQDTVSATGEPAAGNWTVEAEYVILTPGYLSRPQVPKLDGAGVAAFKGHMFHTARWDYGVTGGSFEHVFPHMDKLQDKRVGIIGTGATSIQVVPCLAKYAKEVFVFQRTPSAVYSRGQRETDAKEWQDTIAGHSGWQRERRENMLATISGSALSGSRDLVNDEWTKLTGYAAVFGDPEWASISPDRIPDLMSHYLELDAQHSARMRAKVFEIVNDELTAKGLTPWYPVWCKRPTFSDDYLEVFNEPHVRLVDTAGRGIDKVTADGVVARGIEYPVDVLVLATGYVSPATSRGDPAARAGIRVAGRRGQTIGEKWERGHGMATLHGIATSGFPNLFWLGGSQGAASVNFTHALDAQSQHIAYILATAHERAGPAIGRGRGIVVEVEPEAEEAWSLRVLRGAARWAVLSTCTPGYLNNEGIGLRMAQGLVEPPSQADMAKQARTAPWSAGMLDYLQEIARWRKDGTLSGYRIDLV